MARSQASLSDEYGTPPELFAELDKQFHFVIDAAANRENRLCPFFFSAAERPGDGSLGDALSGSWNPWEDEPDHPSPVIWCNPPYSSPLKTRFVAKAAKEAWEGRCTVVMLLPVDTSTAWWHDFVEPVRKGLVPGDVVFLRGRLRFTYQGKKLGPARFASCVVVFGRVTQQLIEDSQKRDQTASEKDAETRRLIKEDHEKFKICAGTE